MERGKREEAREYREKNKLYFISENILKESDTSLRKLNRDLAILRKNSYISPSHAIAYQEGSARIEDRIDSIYDNFNRKFNIAKERIEGK
jgi:hypothetical protein